MKRVLRLAAALAFVAFVAVPLAEAQIQTGSLVVKAADEQGMVLPGVAVTLRSTVLVSGQATATTDSGGIARFPSLLPGTYTVKVELSGFKTFVREDLNVAAGRTTPLDVQLTVGGLTETVTVKGEAPVVDTTTANLNVRLESKLLETTPGGRDIWSIVEYKVPGLVMDSPDVGGNQGGLQRGITARGTQNNQNTQYLNGVNVGDPSAIGYSGYYYDPSAIDSVQVSTGAQDISVPSSGVFINMITKSGSNRLAGTGLLTYQGKSTQWDNIDETLKRDGIRPNAAATDILTNGNFNAGGPILKDRLFVFGAFNDQRIHVNVVGFPAVGTFPEPDTVERTDITSIFVRPTFQLNSKHRFDITASRQVYDKPNRGAAYNNTPDSTWHEHDILAVYQGLWNWVVTSHMFADTRVSYNSIDFPLNLKTDQQTLTDLTTNNITRANSAEYIYYRRRLQTSSNWQYYVPEFLGGRHELRWGFDNAYTPESTGTHRNDNLALTYRSLPQGTTPAGAQQVTFYSTPLESKTAVNTTTLYAQDSYSIRRLTVIGGVRFERVEGWIPPQQDPPSQWFPDGTVLTTTVGGKPTPYAVTRSFDAVHNIPNWKTVGPRVNMTYDVTGKGKSVIKASIGRYYDVIGTGTPGNLSPNGAVTQTYNWIDKNGDLLYQDGERGTLTRTTVPPTLATLQATRDPNFRRPYRNDWLIGFEHELAPGTRLSITWMQMQEHDQLATVELAVPFSAYTPIQAVDPGRDGVVGTADDGTLTVYNENLPLQTHVTQQKNDDRVANRYKGIEITVEKRYSNRATLVAGYTWSRSDVDMTGLTTPNDALVNAAGRSRGKDHVFKTTGSYFLPWDVLVSGNFKVESGAYVTRRLTVSGMNQGSITVNAEPRGSVTLPTLVTLDCRGSKILKIGATKQVEVGLDVYNLANSNVPYSVRTTTGVVNVRYAADPKGQVATIPQFLSPVNVLAPRIIRLNFTFRFGRS